MTSRARSVFTVICLVLACASACAKGSLEVRDEAEAARVEGAREATCYSDCALWDTLVADIERSDHYQSWSDVCDEWKNYAKTDTLEQNLWGTRDSMPAYRNVVEGVCGLKVDNDKLDHFAPAS